MLLHERQNRIMEQLKTQGSISTADLAQDLSVSTETIRRDLFAMEQQGLLSRVHGGAVASVEMRPYHVLQQRNLRNGALKQMLSQCAVQFVSEGDCIGVDAGSTAISFVNALKESFSSLTVVTHSLDVFELLREHESFRVILCGGTFLREENAFCGSLTLDALSGLYVSKAFIFPAAISLQYGICDNQQDMMLVQRKYLKCCDKVFVLADSTKFERRALHKLCDANPDYQYVSDPHLPDPIKRLYKENGISVITECDNCATGPVDLNED